jgi:hypothetical protein
MLNSIIQKTFQNELQIVIVRNNCHPFSPNYSSSGPNKKNPSLLCTAFYMYMYIQRRKMSMEDKNYELQLAIQSVHVSF